MAGEAPEQVIALGVVASVPEVDNLNAALTVKGVHLIQALSEAARWYGNFHDKWKVASNGLAAWSAFVASGHPNGLPTVVSRLTPDSNVGRRPTQAVAERLPGRGA